jgi:hypothetical protein
MQIEAVSSLDKSSGTFKRFKQALLSLLMKAVRRLAQAEPAPPVDDRYFRIWTTGSNWMTPRFGYPILDLRWFTPEQQVLLSSIGMGFDPLFYEAVMTESETAVPHLSPEERAAWTTHIALTHPGFR